MRFGSVPVERAQGAVLAHAVAAGERRYRKGHRLTGDDVAALAASGVAELIVAEIAADDLAEDDAARAVAEAMRHRGIETRSAATGRVNLHAAEAGVFTVDGGLVDAINAVDPAITVATLPRFAPVAAGQMVATVKIIPFAVGLALVEKVRDICVSGEAFAVHPYRPLRAAVIQTVLPSVKASVLDKTKRVTTQRLARSGSVLTEEVRTAHETGAVADAILSVAQRNDMVLIFGASAMSDFADVVPEAIRRSGGRVVRAGMPVDPGNLLVLGTLAGKHVIGAPGCARSPKENGFDWVLDRLVAGVEITERDIAGMGVGGLLMEIPARPQPREARAGRDDIGIHAVLLAAGRSSRMGGPNKLMALFDGEPLVRRMAGRAHAAAVNAVTVVTGHQDARIAAALSGLPVEVVYNPDYADGLSSSLKAGIAHVAPGAAGALVLLGDMPAISTANLDRLVDAFRAAGGRAVVRAVFNGKRGNPVLLPRALFPAVQRLEGDTGARHIIEADGVEVIDIEIGEGAFVDVDTREAMAGAGGLLQD